MEIMEEYRNNELLVLKGHRCGQWKGNRKFIGSGLNYWISMDRAAQLLISNTAG